MRILWLLDRRETTDEVNAERNGLIQQLMASYAGMGWIVDLSLLWVDDVCKRMQAACVHSPKLPVATFSASNDACGPQHSDGFWIAHPKVRILSDNAVLSYTS